MKRLGFLPVVLALFISGCGKKDGVDKKASKKTSGKLLQTRASDVPVLEETENFFDSNKVADFAFVDDEKIVDPEGRDLPSEGFDVAEADKGFADESFEFIEEEKVASNKDANAEQVGRTSKDAVLTTAALDDLVDSVDQLQREMMEDTLGDEADSIVFKTVRFDINKNDIRNDQKTVVEEDIKLAKQVVEEGKDVVVQGHCCQLGPDSFNLALSQRRAEAIKKEMVRRGVEAKHVKTVGCGNEMPIVWSDAKEKKQLVKELAPNRRAEILVS